MLHLFKLPNQGFNGLQLAANQAELDVFKANSTTPLWERIGYKVEERGY
jgi:hypothetical protein